MRLLLDTHILLWWTVEPGRLRDHEYMAINDDANEIFVSVATVWELSIKQSLGRLDLDEDFDYMMEKNSFHQLPISFDHARGVRHLPHLHGDPFDRMLVTQAQLESLVLVTRDRHLSQYGITLLGDM